MTEEEFTKQVWRPYDRITTADGIPGKVLGVNFTTRSVRAYISGAPEWVNCNLIETHTTGKGKEGDDAAIIEDLHHTVLSQAEKIEKLSEANKELNERISKNHLGELTKAVNEMEQGLHLRKSKIKKIEAGLAHVYDVLAKMKSEE